MIYTVATTWRASKTNREQFDSLNKALKRFMLIWQEGGFLNHRLSKTTGADKEVVLLLVNELIKYDRAIKY